MGWLLSDPSNYVLVRWLFLRGLGAIYLVAFASFGVQVIALIGEHGILPAHTYLEAVRERLGSRTRAYRLCPSLAWLNSSDTALRTLCVAGAVLALLLILGVESTLVLVLLWAAYLSLVSIAQVFLSYQWDALLLEAGFLAIFLVPPSLLGVPGLLGGQAAPPAPLVIYLFRWLAFRLMFMSGMMKLVSRDPTWRSLTALTYHYETQPLPTPLAWYAHRAPLWFQKFSTFVTLAIELVIPFTFAAPAPLRFVGGGLTILLQLLILLTGNFAFFNWLTILLTLFLYDDAFLSALLRAVVPAGRLASPPAGQAAWGGGWGVIPLTVLAVFLVVVGAWYVLVPIRQKIPSKVRRLMDPLLDVAERGRIANPYGLFASMTTQRPEIVIEGSDDGGEWVAYEFKYKAGRLDRRPPIVAPHQPRLDWQMWFVALRMPQVEPWFLNFLVCLLQGTPEVVRLLARNPFPDRPPRYVRAAYYDYHFATAAERASNGHWWRRELLGIVVPPVGRSDGDA